MNFLLQCIEKTIERYEIQDENSINISTVSRSVTFPKLTRLSGKYFSNFIPSTLSKTTPSRRFQLSQRRNSKQDISDM